MFMLSFVCTLAEAQSQPNMDTFIAGRVFDKSTQEPLDYATVSLIQEPSAKLITGSLTNTKGEFKFANIPFGIYRIEVDHISYEKSSVDSIRINEGRESVSLGTIYLTPKVLNLETVNIVSDKPVIENKAGMIIYNVSSDITSQGGLAIDVLKKVPQVTVDADGNVELQGNSNIRFLINGKSSGVFGNNLTDALSSIPASQIKSIEAITNPGARYDSQGTGGIINIILEDNKMKGFNGNLNISPGTKLQTGSANIGVKRSTFGINAFFSGNWRLKSDGPFANTRETTDTIDGLKTTLLQEGNNFFERNGFRSGAGFEWDISKSDNLTGSLGFNHFSFGTSGLTDQEQSVTDIFGNPQPPVFTVRNAESRRNVSSTDWVLAYKRSFKEKGHELDISVNSSYGKPGSSYSQAEYLQGESIPFNGSASKNPGTDNQMEMAVDYSHPVSENFLIETGFKTTWQNLTSIADVRVFSPSTNEYTSDPFQSYNLKYNMKIFAGYLSTSFKLFSFLDLKPGVRYEYTDVDIDYPNTSIPSYGTFVPSMVMSHSFDGSKTLELAYSKRIERPEYRELNPFINRSDPYNITTGNIFLKPEIGNNIELSYRTGFKKGGSLRLALIERINSREIQDVTVFYPEYLIGDSTYTNVSVSSRQNIGEEYNSGISAFITIPVTSKLNLRANLMEFHRYISSNLSVGNLSTGFSTRLNLNATYQLPRDLVCELSGFYRSAGRGLQGKTPQFFIYTFAFRKRFWDTKGSFGFTATNPINRNIRQITTITTENSRSSGIRELPLRSFGVSFTYKFGKVGSNNKKKETDNDSFLPENNQ